MCFHFFTTDFCHFCFLGVFIVFVDCIFSCHQLSLLWMLFWPFFIRYFLLCYYGCCTLSATDLREFFLLSGVFYLTRLPHICHNTASATDLRELFLLSDVFYLTLLPNIWHNLLLSRLLWKPAVLPWRLQGLPPRFKT